MQIEKLPNGKVNLVIHDEDDTYRVPVFEEDLDEDGDLVE